MKKKTLYLFPSLCEREACRAKRAIHTFWITFSHLHYQIGLNTQTTLVLAKDQSWQTLSEREPVIQPGCDYGPFSAHTVRQLPCVHCVNKKWCLTMDSATWQTTNFPFSSVLLLLTLQESNPDKIRFSFRNIPYSLIYA